MNHLQSAVAVNIYLYHISSYANVSVPKIKEEVEDCGANSCGCLGRKFTSWFYALADTHWHTHT